MDMPLAMVGTCPGLCEENRSHSVLRGRTVIEGTIPADLGAKIAALAPHAGMLGDGYFGEATPLSPREHFLGVGPKAAAAWAVRQPVENGEHARAVAWARGYINAASLAKNALASHFKKSPTELAFDYVHLTCRKAVRLEDEPEFRYTVHEGYLNQG